MMRFWGSVFILLAGLAAGLRASGELRRALRKTEELRSLTQKLRLLVTQRRLTLPAALTELEGEWEDYLSGAGELLQRMDTLPFSSIWASIVSAMQLPEAAERSFRALGTMLSEGEIPERAFARTLAELSEQREDCLQRCREKGRIYPALGAGGAVLLIILCL